MKIYPIYHSGFFVELNSHYLLFDYWKKEIPLLDENKPLYVFVSHNHHDHYNPKINEVVSYYKNCKFIVNGIENKNYYNIKENENLIIDDLKITTFKSTDLGVAYLVETEGIKIYHAGDLHLWYWDEDIQEERDLMYKNYINEIKKLQNTNIDVAFLVLDSRQSEKDALLGIELFNDMTDTKLIFPMHYSNDEDLMEKRLEKLKSKNNIVNTRRYKVYEV